MTFIYTDQPDYLDDDQTRFVEVDPTLDNKRDLLDFLASALDFPDKDINWDGFTWYLCDFQWMSERRVVLYHPRLPLEYENSRGTYVQILAEVINFWTREVPDKLDFIVAFSRHLRPEIEHLLTLDIWEGPSEGRLISGYRPRE